jgi:hypothetical protein
MAIGFVSEQLANGVDLDAGHDQVTRERMPKIVESETLHACGVQDACPRFPDVREWLRVI